jgi:hypothetical protein
MNADARESITRAALSMHEAGERLASIIDRLRWSPLTGADERDEVETIVRDALAVGFTVRGYDADGNEAQYPAPDDVLRNTSLVGWPVIQDAREALTDARCACIEAQGWIHAEVYRVEADGAEVSVGCVGGARPDVPEPVLVWVQVEGGPRLGYGTIAEAIQALEDEERETRVMAELEAERIERRIDLTVAEVEARVRAAVNPHGLGDDPEADPSGDGHRDGVPHRAVAPRVGAREPVDERPVVREPLQPLALARRQAAHAGRARDPHAALTRARLGGRVERPGGIDAVGAQIAALPVLGRDRVGSSSRHHRLVLPV